VTSALVSLMGQARIYVALARERLLPPWLAVIEAKRGTPVNATLATTLTAGDSPHMYAAPHTDAWQLGR
jgi:amino acid transporter